MKNHLELKTIEARYLGYLVIRVAWEFHKSPEELKDYYMQIYSGESPTDFKTVSPPLMGLTEWDIVLPYPKEHYQSYYYKLKWWKRNAPGTIWESESVTTQRPADRIAAVLVDKLEMVLEKKSGSKCAIYKAKTEGKKCPECWDPYRSRCIDQSCKLCNGTGIKDGYYEPYYKFCNIEESDRFTRRSDPGDKYENYDAVVVMGPHPHLSIRDLIVEDYNAKVWRVVKELTPYVDKKRVPTKQRWALRAASPNLVEARLKFE